ncbi:MAG TPA: N-acetyltransferase [Candidatus Alistipes intestinipullorum]|nr:N-acetyltransferase [Candidatus Alistipes intestinipullorum]
MEKRYSLIHNAAQHRYEFRLDGGIAYVEYEPDGGIYRLTHTIVPPRFEGQGIAAELVAATLEEFRRRDEMIVPQCSYIVRYIERHPEWQALVARQVPETKA